MKRSGAECGSRTRLICLEGRGPKPLDQPRSHGGLCVSLYGSPSPCDGSYRAPDFGRGFSGGLRALDPSLSLPVCPRPCAGGKANQNSIVMTRVSNCPSNEGDHDGLWQPVAARVSSGFLIAVIMAARFVRPPDSEVKRRVNTSLAT